MKPLEQEVRKLFYCELCGKWNPDMYMIMIWDYPGWICTSCRELLMKNNAGRFRAAGEQTEPAE